jgi:hypothetical protein
MEAILKFNLDDHDDQILHLRCVRSSEMALALWSIRNFRKELEELEDDKKLTSEKVMELIFEIYDRYGIDMDQLMV